MKLWYPFPLLLLGLAALPARAQTTCRLGVRGGANWATATVAPTDAEMNNGHLDGHTLTTSGTVHGQVGAVVEIRRARLALQPGLLFSQKGVNYQYDAYNSPTQSTYRDVSTLRTNWLELPLDLVYTPLGDHGPQLLAGAYAALGLGGRHAGNRYYQNSTSSVRGGSYDEAVTYGSDSYYRRLDAGVRLGLGYQQGPVQVQVSYSWGLVNLHRAPDPQDVLFYSGTNPAYPGYTSYYDYQAGPTYNRVLQLTGTYFFAL